VVQTWLGYEIDSSNGAAPDLQIGWDSFVSCMLIAVPTGIKIAQRAFLCVIEVNPTDKRAAHLILRIAPSSISHRELDL